MQYSVHHVFNEILGQLGQQPSNVSRCYLTPDIG